MKISKLLSMQRDLDESIYEKHNITPFEVLDKQMLALFTELGELANEYRGFKYWSKNQEMNRSKAIEEYVDCLHFFLSVSLSNNLDKGLKNRLSSIKQSDVDNQFIDIFMHLGNFMYTGHDKYFYIAFSMFMSLSEMLEFSEEEISEAYKIKNTVNHLRQEENY